MKCMRCGREMINTIGGNFHCPTCGMSINDLVDRSQNCDMPLPEGFGLQYGWVCPKCGRVLAPHMDYCPCSGGVGEITYASGTGTLNDPDDTLRYSNSSKINGLIL